MLLQLSKKSKIFIIIVFSFLIVVLLFFNYFFPLFSRKITVISDNPDFSLEIKNLSIINDYLEKFGFWNKQGIQDFKSPDLKTSKKLIIHLTDKEQPYFKSSAKEKIVRSTGGYWENNNFHILLYFEPEGLKENSDIGFSFDRYFLQTIHSLTFKQGDIKLADEEFKKIFADFVNSNYSMFLVSEK